MLDKPSEIYSRLMELRFNNNLALEEVQELRNKNHTGDEQRISSIKVI